MNFQIDKKDTLEKFREFVKRFDTKYSNYKPKHSKRLDTPTPFFILDRIRSLYAWVLDSCMLSLRKQYIHDDAGFRKVRNKIDHYINNKIRMAPDGHLYLKVGDIEFDGDMEQYKEYIINNRTKLFSLMRMIIDEMNDVFKGEEVVDKNKIILVDIYESGLEPSPTYNEWAEMAKQSNKLLEDLNTLEMCLEYKFEDIYRTVLNDFLETE